MISNGQIDTVLEEMWAIKREIAAEYPTLDDYFKGALASQEQARANGVKFVSFSPRRIKAGFTMSCCTKEGLPYEI